MSSMLGLFGCSGSLDSHSKEELGLSVQNQLSVKKEKQRKYFQKIDQVITEYEISASEIKSQVNRKSLDTVQLPTSDPFRPCLKQIGDSFYHIKKHVTTEEGQMSIYPKKIHGVAADISDEIIKRIREIAQGKFGLCYVAKSLAPVVNVETDVAVPDTVVCDMCIISSVRSTLVLTVEEDTSPSSQSKITLRYNRALSRGIVEVVLDFTDANFTVIGGVVKVGDLQSKDAFFDRIQTIEETSSKYCVSDSLNMTKAKCLSIVSAFLRAVSVIRNTVLFRKEKGQEELWFLTQEQFVTLTENLGSCAVFVDAVTKAGSTVLMVEVANRLEKTGKTILIGRACQLADVTRSNVCSKVLFSNNVTGGDIPDDICNVVAEATVLENLELVDRSFKQIWLFDTIECSMCEVYRARFASSWCETCKCFVCPRLAHQHPLKNTTEMSSYF